MGRRKYSRKVDGTGNVERPPTVLIVRGIKAVILTTRVQRRQPLGIKVE